MLRRSRISIRPNVRPAGRAGPSQDAPATSQEDAPATSQDAPATSQEPPATSQEPPATSQEPPPQPNPGAQSTGAPADVKEISATAGAAVIDKPSVATTAETATAIGDAGDQTGTSCSATSSSSAAAALQRRKRVTVKPRVAPSLARTSARAPPKSPVRAQPPPPESPAPPDDGQPGGTSDVGQPEGLRSPSRRRPSGGSKQQQPGSTPKPVLPAAEEDPSERAAELSSADKGERSECPPPGGQAAEVVPPKPPDRVFPSREAMELSERAKTLVSRSSKSLMMLQPPGRTDLCSLLNDPGDLQKMAKARKLRALLKQEMHKEKVKKAKLRVKEYTLDTGKMTMRDLIYYLPNTNPMASYLEETACENETVVPPTPPREKSPERAPEPEPRPEPEPEREVEGEGEGEVEGEDDEDKDKDEEAGEEDDDDSMVPRVKVAEDGSLIIDESSLTVVVQRAKGPNPANDKDPIFERGSTTTYSSFRKGTYTKPWSSQETDMFFLAISMVGTDFSMICQLFPRRARSEIKNKFKKEERLNTWRIDKAFKDRRKLDLEFFSKLLEKILEVKNKRKSSEEKKEARKRNRKPKEKKAEKKLTLSDVEEEEGGEDGELDLEDVEGEKENEDISNEGGTPASTPPKKKHKSRHGVGGESSPEKPTDKKDKGKKTNEDEEAWVPEDSEAALPEDLPPVAGSEKTDESATATKAPVIKPAQLRGRAPKPLLQLGRKWGKKVPPVPPVVEPKDGAPAEEESSGEGVSRERVSGDASPSRPAKEKKKDDDSTSEGEEISSVASPKPTRSGRIPKPIQHLNYPAKVDTQPSKASAAKPKRKAKPSPSLKKAKESEEPQTSKLVTLRAASSEYSDDDDDGGEDSDDDEEQMEGEETEEDQHRDSSAPAFVPVSLRSPQPVVWSEVEETMEELDMSVDVPDMLGISQEDALCPDTSYEREHQLDLLVDVIDFLSSDSMEASDVSYNEAAETLLTIGNLSHLSQSTQDYIYAQDCTSPENDAPTQDDASAGAPFIIGDGDTWSQDLQEDMDVAQLQSGTTPVTETYALIVTEAPQAVGIFGLDANAIDTVPAPQIGGTPAIEAREGTPISGPEEGAPDREVPSQSEPPSVAISQESVPQTRRARLPKVKPMPNLGRASRTAQSKSHPAESPMTSQPAESPMTSQPAESPMTSQPTESPMTSQPTESPMTSQPTESPMRSQPTESPMTSQLTESPMRSQPTESPMTSQPTESPMRSQPTESPMTSQLTESPMTSQPTESPMTSQQPTESPMRSQPTESPMTSQPTESPMRSQPTESPMTSRPTESPMRSQPAESPMTSRPTESPMTSRPTESPMTSRPTASPMTSRPTESPMRSQPTESPMRSQPTESPMTSQPTESPMTSQPTESPMTSRPAESPMTSQPTESPMTSRPTESPMTSRPTESPMRSQPTESPMTSRPTESPMTSQPTKSPMTSRPTASPMTSQRTESPMTSRPTESPMTSRPTASPMTSQRTESPMTSRPTESPMTSRPTASPMTSQRTESPMTSRPTESPMRSQPAESPMTSPVRTAEESGVIPSDVSRVTQPLPCSPITDSVPASRTTEEPSVVREMCADPGLVLPRIESGSDISEQNSPRNRKSRFLSKIKPKPNLQRSTRTAPQTKPLSTDETLESPVRTTEDTSSITPPEIIPSDSAVVESHSVVVEESITTTAVPRLQTSDHPAAAVVTPIEEASSPSKGRSRFTKKIQPKPNLGRASTRTLQFSPLCTEDTAAHSKSIKTPSGPTSTESVPASVEPQQITESIAPQSPGSGSPSTESVSASVEPQQITESIAPQSPGSGSPSTESVPASVEPQQITESIAPQSPGSGPTSTESVPASVEPQQITESITPQSPGSAPASASVPSSKTEQPSPDSDSVPEPRSRSDKPTAGVVAQTAQQVSPNQGKTAEAASTSQAVSVAEQNVPQTTRGRFSKIKPKPNLGRAPRTTQPIPKPREDPSSHSEPEVLENTSNAYSETQAATDVGPHLQPQIAETLVIEDQFTVADSVPETQSRETPSAEVTASRASPSEQTLTPARRGRISRVKPKPSPGPATTTACSEPQPTEESTTRPEEPEPLQSAPEPAEDAGKHSLPQYFARATEQHIPQSSEEAFTSVSGSRRLTEELTSETVTSEPVVAENPWLIEHPLSMDESEDREMPIATAATPTEEPSSSQEKTEVEEPSSEQNVPQTRRGRLPKVKPNLRRSSRTTQPIPKPGEDALSHSEPEVLEDASNAYSKTQPTKEDVGPHQEPQIAGNSSKRPISLQVTSISETSSSTGHTAVPVSLVRPPEVVNPNSVADEASWLIEDPFMVTDSVPEVQSREMPSAEVTLGEQPRAGEKKSGGAEARNVMQVGLDAEQTLPLTRRGRVSRVKPKPCLRPATRIVTTHSEEPEPLQTASQPPVERVGSPFSALFHSLPQYFAEPTEQPIPLSSDEAFTSNSETVTSEPVVTESSWLIEDPFFTDESENCEMPVTATTPAEEPSSGEEKTDVGSALQTEPSSEQDVPQATRRSRVSTVKPKPNLRRSPRATESAEDTTQDGSKPSPTTSQLSCSENTGAIRMGHSEVKGHDASREQRERSNKDDSAQAQSAGDAQPGTSDPDQFSKKAPPVRRARLPKPNSETVTSEPVVTESSWLIEDPFFTDESENCEMPVTATTPPEEPSSGEEKTDVGSALQTEPSSEQDVPQATRRSRVSTVKPKPNLRRSPRATESAEDTTQDSSKPSPTTSQLSCSENTGAIRMGHSEVKGHDASREQRERSNEDDSAQAQSAGDAQPGTSDPDQFSKKAPPVRRVRLPKPKPNLSRRSQPACSQPVRDTTPSELDVLEDSASQTEDRKPSSDTQEPAGGARDGSTAPTTPVRSLQGATPPGARGGPSRPVSTVTPAAPSEQVLSEPEESFFILSLTEIPVSPPGAWLSSTSHPLSCPTAEAPGQVRSSPSASVSSALAVPGGGVAGGVGDAVPDPASPVTETPEEPHEMAKARPSGLTRPVESSAEEEVDLPCKKRRVQETLRRAKLQVKPRMACRRPGTTAEEAEPSSRTRMHDTTQESELTGPPEASVALGSGDAAEDRTSGAEASHHSTLPSMSSPPDRPGRRPKGFLSLIVDRDPSAVPSGKSPPAKAASQAPQVNASCAGRKRAAPTTALPAAAPSTSTDTRTATQPSTSTATRLTTQPVTPAGCTEVYQLHPDPEPSTSSFIMEVAEVPQDDSVVDMVSVDEEPTNISQFFFSDIITEVDESDG